MKKNKSSNTGNGALAGLLIGAAGVLIGFLGTKLFTEE